MLKEEKMSEGVDEQNKGKAEVVYVAIKKPYRETKHGRDKVGVLTYSDRSVSQCPVFPRFTWPPSCIWEMI